MSRPIVRCLFGAALLLALALLAVGPRSARAANIRYAAPGAGGAQPCLQSAPCPLERALTGTGPNGVADGDSVVVEPGTYHPAAAIEVERAISIGGEAGAPPPLIEGAGNYGLVTKAEVRLDDLRIDQASGVLGLLMLGGGVGERMYITNENGGEAACSVGGGVLRDSVCADTAAGGKGIGLQASGNGTTTATLDNVVAVGSVGIAVETGVGYDATVEGTNVIASGSTYDLLLTTDSSASTSSTIKLSHSDFSTHHTEGSNNAFTSPGARQNVSAKPLFVDAAAGDFHEAPGSPTIATGDLSVLESGELDLDRAPRATALTCGAALTVDIGAYQSPAGECAPPPSSSASGSPSPLPSPAPAPTAPAPAGPRVRVNCPMSAKPGGCKLALQVVAGKPKLVKGKVGRPRPESAVARVELGAGKSTLVTLKPKANFAARLEAAAKLLVREVETVKGTTHTVYRQLKVVR